jgi:hypothetical protein
MRSIPASKATYHRGGPGYPPVFAGVRSPPGGREPAIWTGIDPDSEAFRVGMQRPLFNDLGITVAAPKLLPEPPGKLSRHAPRVRSGLNRAAPRAGHGRHSTRGFQLCRQIHRCRQATTVSLASTSPALSGPSLPQPGHRKIGGVSPYSRVSCAIAGVRPDPGPGRAYAQQFTPAAAAALYLDAYRRLLASRARSRHAATAATPPASPQAAPGTPA